MEKVKNRRTQKRNKKVFGVGVNDFAGNVCGEDGKLLQAYRDWYNMLSRCYGKDKRNSTYAGCSVCSDWLLSSNFIKWHNEHYVNGWALDKDILVKGNKVYSPQTCCFVPQLVNTIFITKRSCRGEYPIGVCKNTNRNGYRAIFFYKDGSCKKKCCRSIEQAFVLYKESKERYIKHIADKYKEQLETRVYKALYDYQVEITD